MSLLRRLASRLASRRAAGAALAAAAIFAIVASGRAHAETSALHFVQGGDTIRLSVYVDQRRNRAEIKRITEEIEPDKAYAYTQTLVGGRLQVRLASNELLRLWKGGGTITPSSGALFESADQFLPVLLLLDVTNDATAPVHITGSGLEVASSQSDLQPLIVMSGFGTTCGGAESKPSFVLTNAGWGRAENAALSFAFGRDRPATPSFMLPIGAIGVVDVSLMRAASDLAPRLAALQRQPPRCPSSAQLPQCLARLERDGLLGGLSGQVRVLDGGDVITRMTGALEYSWRDTGGATQQTRTPIQADLPLFRIESNAPECGAGAPAEGGFRPIKLALDRSNYLIPLPYRGRLGPRENRRLELALVADRASRHLFRVVLELSDGRRVASMPVELSYFTPRMQRGEPRAVR